MPTDPLPLPYAGGLTPYRPSAEVPWGPARAAHLVRRTGFGATPEEVARVVSEGAVAAVARLVGQAEQAPLPPEPNWPAPATRTDDDARRAFVALTVRAHRAAAVESVDEAAGARDPATPLREKLALAWHARIPVRQAHNARHSWLYWQILRTHAFGSYRELIREVGTTPAMLLYLDGATNRAGAPNENYARELLELFTMGRDGLDGPNYTQRDVAELARALTGYVATRLQPDALFRPGRHDRGDKTLFGRTGPFDASSAVDWIFEARAEPVSLHVARHLYRTFVHAVPQPEVVGEMAARLRADDFVVGGTLRALLGSAHFFAGSTLGALVKSPLDHALGLVRELGVPSLAPYNGPIRTRVAAAGFRRLRPPDVGGWPGGRTWLDTTRLTQRWLTSDALLDRARRERALLAALPSPDEPEAVVDALAARMLAVPLAPALRGEAVAVLLGGIPAYEWRASAPGADLRVRELLKHLCRLPEYQLT